jgi:hypothetical protein
MSARVEPLTSSYNMVNIMKHQLGTVIARRNYFRKDDPRSTPIVEIRIGQPVASPHSPDEFMCSFEIKIPQSLEADTVFGIDELQALQLALGSVAARLQSLNTSLGLNLRWDGDEHGDLGIRIPVL